MRNKLVSFGVVVVALVFVLQVSAQRQFITEKEYFDSVSKADLRDVEAYRWISKDETLDHGLIVKSVISSFEVAGGRWRRHTRITEGKSVTDVDQILINSIHYERSDDGDWTKTDIRSAPPTVEVAPEVIRIGYGSPCNQFTVEPSGFGGVTMRLYEQYNVQSWSAELIFRISRVWIGEDGKRYREERISGNVSPHEETSRSLKTYIYDQPIKIEAPIP